MSDDIVGQDVSAVLFCAATITPEAPRDGCRSGVEFIERRAAWNEQQAAGCAAMGKTTETIHYGAVARLLREKMVER